MLGDISLTDTGSDCLGGHDGSGRSYIPQVIFKENGVTDVDFERRVSALQYIVENKEKGRVIMLAVLYLLFAVLIVLNAYVEKYSIGLCIFSGCLALVGIYFGVLHIIALTKMK